MKFLSDRYVSVYNHRGFDICTLKVAAPANDDEMGYVVDNAEFSGQVFDAISDAICTIDKKKSDGFI